MARPLTLRQIEAFKAFIETGTVSQAGDVLRISQPAVSKLLAHLETDTELELFTRTRGRLIPNERAIQLYREVDRTFAGIGQIERAVEAIRREELGQISIGVMPALSGAFIAQVAKHFHQLAPGVFISVVARSSQILSQWVISKQVDVGLLNPPFDHPLVETRPFLQRRLVCIMPKRHPLEQRSMISIDDIASYPFIAFQAGSQTRSHVDAVLRKHDIELSIASGATNSLTLCQLVAAGLGISLVHPVLTSETSNLTTRPFEVPVMSSFIFCRALEARKPELVAKLEQATMSAVATSDPSSA